MARFVLSRKCGCCLAKPALHDGRSFSRSAGLVVGQIGSAGRMKREATVGGVLRDGHHWPSHTGFQTQGERVIVGWGILAYSAWAWAGWLTRPVCLRAGETPTPRRQRGNAASNNALKLTKRDLLGGRPRSAILINARFAA